MGYLNISRAIDTNYRVAGITTDGDIRSDPSDWEKDQFSEMIRVVLTFDIKTITSLSFVDGLVAQSSLDGVYFQGTGPFKLSPPNGFGQWILIRQQMDPIDADGSEMFRVTEEYASKLYGTDGNPKWSAMDWE